MAAASAAEMTLPRYSLMTSDIRKLFLSKLGRLRLFRFPIPGSTSRIIDPEHNRINRQPLDCVERFALFHDEIDHLPGYSDLFDNGLAFEVT
jgi:hypothetical protein